MSPCAPHASRALVSLLLLAALTVGCATDTRHRRATAPVRELPHGYDLSALQRAAYGAGAHASTPQHELIAIVEEHLPRAEGKQIEHDPALDEVAAVVAATLAETEQMPAASLVRWLLWQAGVASPHTGTFGGFGVAMAPSSLYDEELAKNARAASVPSRGVLRFGVARVKVGSYVGQALILSDTIAELDPVEKAVSAGEELTLSGRLLVDAKDVVLYIDDGTSAVRKMPVRLEADRSFSLSFQAPSAPGERFLELGGFVGEDAELPVSRRWQRQIALFPLSVDVPLPDAPDETIRQPRANPALETFAEVVLERINASREEVGARPLKANPRLVQLAERFVSEGERGSHMREAGDQLASAGYAVRRTQQIASSFEYLEEDLWQLMQSPAMRAALLDDDLKEVGLAFREDRGGFRGRMLLVQPVGVLNPERERAALLRHLNRFRERQEQSTVTLDDSLTKLVQEYAEQVCAGEVSLDDTTPLQQKVDATRRRDLRSFGIFSIYGPYVDPSDARNHRDLLTRDFTTTGIGVCQGRILGTPGTELVVVLTGAP